jgi:hypothetical protein
MRTIWPRSSTTSKRRSRKSAAAMPHFCSCCGGRGFLTCQPSAAMRRRAAVRGHSSAGRALQWHCRGHRFDPGWLHHLNEGLGRHRPSPSLFAEAWRKHGGGGSLPIRALRRRTSPLSLSNPDRRTRPESPTSVEPAAGSARFRDPRAPITCTSPQLDRCQPQSHNTVNKEGAVRAVRSRPLS